MNRRAYNAAFRAAHKHLSSEAGGDDLRSMLILAAGNLWGVSMVGRGSPEAEAAVVVAFQRLFPEAPLPTLLDARLEEPDLDRLVGIETEAAPPQGENEGQT